MPTKRVGSLWIAGMLGLSVAVTPGKAFADAEAPNACKKVGQACIDDGKVGVCDEGEAWDVHRQRLTMQLSCGPDYAEIAAAERRQWIARGVLAASVLAFGVGGAILWRRRRPAQSPPPEAE